jgi:hypothetical protein
MVEGEERKADGMGDTQGIRFLPFYFWVVPAYFEKT